MRISIAIITRNRANSLKKCLFSLTKQTLKPSQVVIVDNASSDNTKETTYSFKRVLPIKYVVENTVGISYARNRALKEARGDILSFIDDDCTSPYNWLENIKKAHKKYPQAAIQGWFEGLPRANYVNTLIQFNAEKGFLDNTVDSKILILNTRNASFKLPIIKKLGLKFDTSMKRYEDIDFAKQLLHAKQEIIFEPSIKVSHYKKIKIRDFLIHRFDTGRARAIVYQKWPKRYFPKRGRLWWLRRSFSFFIRQPYLFPIFVLEMSAILLGSFYQSSKGQLSNQSLPKK